jgi:SAM-dependent methyltransferase
MSREQRHRSSPELLERRTLERDHSRLAELLRPGMRVLDVGCGSGAITAGIARAVQPGGRVVGLDRDAGLIERALARTDGVPGLAFRTGSVLDLAERDAYDVVTAARALQWIPDADAAIARMFAAVRPGGLVVALDYDHADLVWRPHPPGAVRRLYDAFLAWRADGGLDNRMGTSLPGRFTAAGLVEVRSSRRDETERRGDPEFGRGLRVWAVVFEDLGPELVRSGRLDEDALANAVREYDLWCDAEATYQAMILRAVEGRRPSSPTSAESSSASRSGS